MHARADSLPSALAPRNADGFPLETVVVGHVAVALWLTPWLVGGNIWWARIGMAWWCSLALPLTVVAAWRGHGRARLVWLLPWVALVVLGGLSCLNPSFRSSVIEGRASFAYVGEPHPGWPSSVNPAATWRELWFLGAGYLTMFNLVLVVSRRRALRLLLAGLAVSALLLAVLGTLQKLGNQGFFFGALRSPNPRFFASFIYYNHWGAFMVLSGAAGVGCLFHTLRHQTGRDFWHSPGPMLVLGALLIFATGPISGSRAATAMAGLLFLTAIGQLLTELVQRRRVQRRSSLGPVALVGLGAAIVLAAVAWLATQSIRERAKDTREQLAGPGLFASRLELYGQTWALFQQRPLFGWGLQSYGTAIQLTRPRPVDIRRQYEAGFVDAHSDWLQSLAETGVAGTACAVGMGALPVLASVRRRHLRQPLVTYPLLGCTLVALYAAVEFPFGNGAVFLAFWGCCFIAVRHCALADRESAAPAAV